MEKENSFTFTRDPKLYVSPKIVKKEIKTDYFGFVSVKDIKQDEILLEEEAFTVCSTPTSHINLTLWAEFIEKNIPKTIVESLWPRCFHDGLSFLLAHHTGGEGGISWEQMRESFQRDVLKSKFSPTMIPMLIAKISSNMFTWDFMDENLLFSQASFFNSCEPLEQNLRYTISKTPSGGRKICMKAQRDIRAGEEIVFFYGSHTKFLS